MVKSPCINVCRIDKDNVCIGCYRTLNEIDSWSKLKDKEKLEVRKKAVERRIEKGGDYFGFPG
ncbi:MAG: DUF1289 domain-containing protein [bacterium]